MPKSYSTPNPLELLLREVYVHRAVRKSLPHIFIREHAQIRQAARRGSAGSRFEDAVYFFGVAAATGVRKNLTYNALADLLKAIRRPNHEISGQGLKFESVISRKTYDRQRRHRYPGAMASRNISGIEKKLEMEYKLMVTLSPKLQDSRPVIKNPGTI
jgi:hypothetical protein